MSTMFKKGDRVRLKAWVTEPILKGCEKTFYQGIVGVVDSSVRKLYGAPFVDLKVPTTKRGYLRAFVAVEDLELMPERQVHVVKDGKVYELRDNAPNRVGTNLCAHCGLLWHCPNALDGNFSCFRSVTNFQEVKSGKLVS